MALRQTQAFAPRLIHALPQCPDCDGTGYIAIAYDEVEPCGCIAPDVKGAIDQLLIELEASGIADPLNESFTLAAILDDLTRLLGIAPPVRVQTILAA